MFSFVTLLTLPSFKQYISNLTAIGFAGFPDLQSDPQTLQVCSRTCRHSRSAVGLASTPDLQSDLQAFQICSRTCKHSKSAVGFAGIPDLQSDLQAFQICNRTWTKSGKTKKVDNSVFNNVRNRKNSRK